ncbi:MAG TPA: GCN5 family acetyltransferase [Pedococcus sp.]
MTVVDSLRGAAGEMADAELAEAEFMYALESGAPADTREALGIATARLGGGVVLSMRNDPAGGYWNKALGFGVTEPVTRALVGDVLDFYRDNGSTVACLQVAPGALPEDWADICAELGLEDRSTWVKLVRDASPAPRAATDLRVGTVTEQFAVEWATVFCTAFGMPLGHLVTMVAAVVHTAGFHPLAAWDGDRVVAGANLYLTGDRASFCGAATLEQARGRGAQSVFFHDRVEVASRHGGRVLVAETYTEDEGQHNPSLHNMRRAGFRDLYVRHNWVWRAA